MIGDLNLSPSEISARVTNADALPHCNQFKLAHLPLPDQNFEHMPVMNYLFFGGPNYKFKLINYFPGTRITDYRLQNLIN